MAGRRGSRQQVREGEQQQGNTRSVHGFMDAWCHGQVTEKLTPRLGE
jgi:hypothetical protein